MSETNKLIRVFTLLAAAAAILLASCGRVSKKDTGSAHSDSKQSEMKEGYTDAPSATKSVSEAKGMPVYGNWKNFTMKDGLPADRIYAVKVDGDKVYAGTHHGLAVYERGKWKTYGKKDGLAHDGIVSVDVCQQTGDVWIGTLGGLNRWSAGKFETFNQFNSGMPNDLVYNVVCDGSDIWMATGGGVGHYDSYLKSWEIFTEMNAPMHEPWTYALSIGDGKVFIAAWGGGVIEYNKETRHFRDYVDPDGFMEIDLQPDDGPVHDITTSTYWSNGILWVSSYFGLSRYDGKYWKGYFDHDSGLASNFINFVKANGRVAYACTDRGLSTTDGETWVTYKKFDDSEDGVAIIYYGGEKIKEIRQSPSLAHSFIINAEPQGDVLWVATSKGLSRGEVLR